MGPLCRLSVLGCALSVSQPLFAQGRASAIASEARVDGAGTWEPLGLVPVDQAGAGRRGYVIAGESAEVAEPGASRIALHTVAANNFYREEHGGFLISQRVETHTVGLDYRRGFKVGRLPRFEVGGQIQFSESDEGALNGVILGVERFWSAVSGSESATNVWRTREPSLAPGTLIVKDGRPLYQSPGTGSGLGDFALTVKALVVDAAPQSRAARVAARVSVNVAGSSAFTQGNFAGAGLSVDKKVAEWMAIHGDVRGQVVLDRQSVWGLPLGRTSWAFSAGPELKLGRQGSISLQIDGSSTPYLPTGASAFDDNYGDVTVGASRRFRAGRRVLVSQIYARENINLPFRVRWNTDPDLAIGLKFAIH